MGKFIDLSGKRFGKWRVISYEGKRRWRCECECGNVHPVLSYHLKSGASTRCRECSNFVTKTHGLKGTKAYQHWADIKQRCYNPKRNDYKNYGGRDIRMCSEWKDDPVAFCEWYNKNKIDGLTIDRIDNNGDYSPSNCRFVTMADNLKNRRPRNEWNFKK